MNDNRFDQIIKKWNDDGRQGSVLSLFIQLTEQKPTKKFPSDPDLKQEGPFEERIYLRKISAEAQREAINCLHKAYNLGIFARVTANSKANALGNQPDAIERLPWIIDREILKEELPLARALVVTSILTGNPAEIDMATKMLTSKHEAIMGVVTRGSKPEYHERALAEVEFLLPKSIVTGNATPSEQKKILIET